MIARAIEHAAPYVAHGAEHLAHWLSSALGSFCVQVGLQLLVWGWGS